MRNQHLLLEVLQVAYTKAQGVLQCSNKGTAFVSHGAGQACVCYTMLVQWHLEEHACLTCNNHSSIIGEEGITLLLFMSAYAARQHQP